MTVSAEPSLVLRVDEVRPRGCRADNPLRFVYCWLDEDGVPVAVVKLFCPGPDRERVVSAVEVRPECRGRRLGATLMDMVVRRFGDVYLTGSFSRSGWAAMRHMPPLPYLPDWSAPRDPVTGTFPPCKPHVDDVEGFQFVDWERGVFVEC